MKSDSKLQVELKRLISIAQQEQRTPDMNTLTELKGYVRGLEAALQLTRTLD